MVTRTLVLGSAVVFPLLFAQPAGAQRVSADIRIGGGPVFGRILINDHEQYRPRGRAIRRVEWVRTRDYRRNDWFRNFRRDARVVVVFYDRQDDCYYLDRFSSGLQEIRVFERDGRYYRLEDDRYGDGYDPRYDDRYDPRYDDRYDPRYDDRYDRRYDDRYDPRHDDRRGSRSGHDERRDGRDHRRDDRWNRDNH